MRGLRGFFKSLRQGKKSKQVVFTTLLLFLTVSVIFVLPSLSTEKTTEINTSTAFIQITSKANETIYWNKTYGGSDGDYGYCVKQTADGGYIVVGSTYSYGAGQEDVWLVKTDPSGNREWSKTYGRGWNDYGYFVEQTSDGGYIITGYYGGDVWLVKTDGMGNEMWNNSYRGSYTDCGECVKQTSEGGYIIVGYTQSFGAGGKDVWLIKTDENGSHQWNKTYGGTEYDSGSCVVQTSDGGFIVAGWTSSFGAGHTDVWLIKTDTSGNMTWNRTYGGTSSDLSYSVVQTSDGGYIVVGTTESYGTSYVDVWLIKTNSSGHHEWDKTYGGTNHDRGCCVLQDDDGGYIILGNTKSFSAGYNDFWLVKTDESGNHQWDKAYGGTNDDYGYWVEQTTDGGYILTGYTLSYGGGDSNVWLIKTDANGVSVNPSPPVNPSSPDSPQSTYPTINYYGVLAVVIVLFLGIFFFAIRDKVKISIGKRVFYALPCPVCGAFIKMGAISCNDCGEEFQTCVVCNLSILEDSINTPCCQSFAHRSHLREWLKIKGKCPNCGEKLEEWDITKSEN